MKTILQVLGIVSFLFNVLFLFLWYLDHRPPLRKLRWKMALRGIEKIKKAIQQSNYKPEIIIGIYTIGYGGGGVVGDVLASSLQIPMLPVCVSLANKNNKEIEVFGVLEEFVKGKKVLIVDDVCTTGRTLKVVGEYMRPKCAEFKIAVVVKPITKLPLPINVDFWAFETPYYVIDREWRIQPELRQ